MASSPEGAVLWWDEHHDDHTVRFVAVEPPTAYVRAWNEPDLFAMPGWTLTEPNVGQTGHEVRWFTGHAATSAVVVDAYRADLSVMLTVITAAAQQLENEATFDRAAPRPRSARAGSSCG